jgi:dolichol-phosphate mannosyltransferase
MKASEKKPQDTHVSSGDLNSFPESVKPNDLYSLDLSIVVPVHNELDNLPRLLDSIADVLKAEQIAYEIICVDDGSNDGSDLLLREQAVVRGDLKAIILRRNYGQTAAMAAGFEYALGRVIVTMDGDMQNDPFDIPKLLLKLDQGYDLVSGWRKKRQDAAVTRLLPSKIANLLIGSVTGVQLHDYGCSLKAYRTELVRDMNLYGELHRFIPALAAIEGARIAELPVNHYPRRFGKSKYGLGRTIRVLMDLITVAFIKTFLTKPMHAFGSSGLVSITVGVLIALYLAYIKLFQGQAIGGRPLMLFAIVLFLAGLQLFCFGLLAELLMRTYHESQKRPIYRIREIVS